MLFNYLSCLILLMAKETPKVYFIEKYMLELLLSR